MEELQNVLKIAFNKMKENDYKLNNGDSFVFEGENFCLIVGLKDGNLKTEFIGGKAISIDARLSIFDEVEE